jgi:NitT/TauT family transport system permease protein
MKKGLKSLLAQVLFVIAVLVLWQVLYQLKIWPKVLFPSLGMIAQGLVSAFTVRGFGTMVMHSMGLLVRGLVLGIVVAMICSSLSVINNTVAAIYNLIVSMFDLIPGIALIPVAILWLGIGDAAIIFMVFHSVVWPLSRSVIDGFRTVPQLYLEVGENIGLSKTRLILGVFLPAALPRIFSGIKTGWARAWRGLISAEMVFGGGSALGIGYFVTDRRTNLDISGIFAAILVIIVIGVIIEYGIFQLVEKNTFKKWGMSR